VTMLLAGYTREAVLPSSSVGHRWGVTRKVCSGLVRRRRRRKLRSAPSLIYLSIPWRKHFSKTFAFHLLHPIQGNPRPNPNPIP
jgi:hypothetical protein